MTSTPIGTFILLAAIALLIAVAAAAGTIYYLSNSQDASIDAGVISAAVAVASLALAAIAIIAAFWTVHQQQLESQRHRQMETVHLLSNQYEAIFNDIYEMRGSPVAEIVAERIYNRYFTVLKRGHRCYRQGLVSREDFEDWTATTITRFARGGSLLDVDDNSRSDEMSRQYRRFEERGAGTREDFRKYMRAVLGEADQEANEPEGSDDDPPRAARLRTRAKRVLDARVAKRAD